MSVALERQANPNFPLEKYFQEFGAMKNAYHVTKMCEQLSTKWSKLASIARDVPSLQQK